MLRGTLEGIKKNTMLLSGFLGFRVLYCVMCSFGVMRVCIFGFEKTNQCASSICSDSKYQFFEGF